MSNKNPSKRRNWAPYILLLPTLIYLVLFFAYPMFQALRLAFYKEGATLQLYEAPAHESNIIDEIERASQVLITDKHGNQIDAEGLEEFDETLYELWYFVESVDDQGQDAEGWVISGRIRIDDENPEVGTIRRIRRAGVDPRTLVYSEAGIQVEENVVAYLEANTEVTIVDESVMELWYEIELEDGSKSGWARGAFLNLNDDVTAGFIRDGDTGRFTTEFIDRMLGETQFSKSLTYTLLLIVVVVPLQFVLAFIMALVVQARLKGNSFFLYIFTIPLGVSELAVGIVWLLIFDNKGYVNSLLTSLGLMDADNPFIYISAENREWIFIAIALAEIWRATSIVMIILVSGLQAVPDSLLEASEIFGANMWQRIRHVILPLLKPSIQVALILRTILAFQVFAVVLIIGGGDVVTTLARETYRYYSGETLNANMAAAYAGFILFMSIFSAFFYLRAVRTQEEAAKA